MIYSRFGTKLTLVSKKQEPNGLLCIQATVADTSEVRDFYTGDLTADDGFVEINETVDLLPWKKIPPVTHRKARRPQ